MKKATLFLVAALLISYLLLVPMAPAYAATDLIYSQAAAGQLSENQTEPLIDAVTPTTTPATTTIATQDSIPGQAATSQPGDNQTAPLTAVIELPDPPPPATATIIAAPALPVTATSAVSSTTNSSVSSEATVTIPTSPTASNILPSITQADGTLTAVHHFPLPSDNGTLHFPSIPTPSDNGTAHFPTFPAPSDNSTAHVPSFQPDRYHTPYTSNPLPAQTYRTYPSYPYEPGYTLAINEPVIGSFTASPDYIQSGQAATLSWDVSGASVITISPTVGSVTNSGSYVVTPTYTTTYTLYAYNGQGAVNASTIVTVTPYVGDYEGTYGTPVISSFTASPNYIQAGQAATLSWTVNNADTVTISPLVGTVANTGSFDVTPTYTTTYTISAYSDTGTVSAGTTVTVAPNASSFVTPAYAVDTGVNTDTVSSGTPSAGTVNTSQVNEGIGTILNSNETNSGRTTAVNLWPMYLLLGLLVVASVVLSVLLGRKPIVANTQRAGMKTEYATSATTIVTATQPATLTPMTTIIEIGLPAKFVSSAGITMPITGKPLGRKDFQALTLPDKIDTISRQHILVTYTNGVYYIEDLNSTNGTKLNGSEIKGSGKHTIENGDTVELAHVLSLTFKV